MLDADKKVEKAKKERPGLYQSSQNPKHFGNEGDEYVTQDANQNNTFREDTDRKDKKNVDAAPNGSEQRGN